MFWTEPGGPDIVWHGVQVGSPDLRSDSHTLAFALTYPEHNEHLYVIFNLYWEPLSFALPPLEGGKRYFRVVDTALPSPLDYTEPASAPPVDTQAYAAQGRSVVILIAR